MNESSSPSRGVALLGVCGGIAAYKAVEVASRLRKEGWEVHVAMTQAAQRFVTPLTFAGVTGRRVLAAGFPTGTEGDGDDLYPHLYPSTRAALFILLPATANTIGKIANGIADDIVSTVALSLPATCRRLVCPAMNVEMWRKPVVQQNVSRLEAAGWLRIGPAAGELACGMTGEGRMSEPAEIVAAVNAEAALPLRGRTVLVISGPTHEHFDPVRFIGNPSSGRMGRALAEEARAAGATVLFVTGPVAGENLPRGPGIEIAPVVSADEMLQAAQERFARSDVVIYAAAVADYKPAEKSDQKLPKRDGELTLRLVATPDVAATLNAAKRPGQVCIGFALQTDDGPGKARAKLAKKHLDGIVLNALDALGGDSGRYRYLSATGTGDFADWGELPKRECARRILAEAAAKLRTEG